MKSPSRPLLKKFLLPLMVSILPLINLSAIDYVVTGRVTDPNGTLIPDAKVAMMAGTREYAAITRPDGTYSLRISGLYDNISGLIEVGMPYPNHFSHSVNIPFIINSQGDIRFNIYNFSGRRFVRSF
jgi:hypothetical protein